MARASSKLLLCSKEEPFPNHWSYIIVIGRSLKKQDIPWGLYSPTLQRTSLYYPPVV
jgi:hypothetical protein